MTVIDTNTNCTGHLDQLKARGVTAIGRYYCAGHNSKLLMAAEAKHITDAGLRIFTVYEDSGSPSLTIERGRQDGNSALQRARDAGQPKGTPIYFALEGLEFGGYGPRQLPGVQMYVTGIQQAFGDEYAVGVYSDGAVLAGLLDEGLIKFAWLSASTAFPGSHEFAASKRWHIAQTRQIDQDWNGVSVDVNEVAGEDFGQWSVADKPSAVEADEPDKPSYVAVAYKSRTANALAVHIAAATGALGYALERAWDGISTLSDSFPQLVDQVRSNVHGAEEMAGWFAWNWPAVQKTVAVVAFVVACALLLHDKRKAQSQ